MELIYTLLLAIVEGLTEYLPVSSTAHMRFTTKIFNIPDDNFFRMLTMCMQFGAILAVVTLYHKKFFDLARIDFYFKLVFGVLPALVLGYLLDDYIDAVLDKPIPIALTLIIGGIVFLYVDEWFKNPQILSENNISIKKAIIVGFWQCLAMMPGMSRSAASIIGGMQQKLSREAAAEFSFFLAVPTMLAVSVYSLFLKKYIEPSGIFKGYELLIAQQDKLHFFVIGNIVAYVVAMLAIKYFVEMIKKYGFKPWGYYRIIVGSMLLAYFFIDK